MMGRVIAWHRERVFFHPLRRHVPRWVFLAAFLAIDLPFWWYGDYFAAALYGLTFAMGAALAREWTR